MNSAAPLPAVKFAKRAGQGRMHLLMLLVTVCWASNIIAGKQALTGFDAMALAQLRVLATAVIYSVGFLATGGIRRLHLSPRKWVFLVAMAANGIAVNQLTFIGGMARSTVAHTSLIVALGPVMVLVIAVVIRLELLTGWKFLGMVIAFAGVGILTADKAGQVSGGHWVGDVILMKEVASDFDTLTLSTLTFTLAALMMLPFCVHAVMLTNWAALRLEAWWGLGFLIVLGTVLPYLLFAYVMTEMAASRAAAFNYLQPLIAIALGIWLLSERMTSKVLIGGGLILVGIYLTEREQAEEKSPAKKVA